MINFVKFLYNYIYFYYLKQKYKITIINQKIGAFLLHLFPNLISNIYPNN